ncbi:lipase family protein (plasmid) [Nocardia sp. CA-084685]|uniref:lipase family protein n=1 Tax=Nocardia sp. CA-084685 TaxID=3239970 RepID=UPI003D96F6B8
MRTQRFLRGALTFACAGILTVGISGGAAAASPLTPASLADDFYSTPADLESTAPGDVLRSRPMPPIFAVVASVTQLQFHSTDSLARPIAAVATVLTPPNHRPDSPIFVWDHATNSLGPRCAPSQAMWSTDPDVVMRETPALDPILALGWTVVIPDHLGPDSAYGAARMGGQITLDAARAAVRFEPLHLNNSPIALAGYSGGGMSAAFAAAMAPTYAPELRIVGSALGGVPVSIETMANALWHNRHPAFGIAAAVAVGLSREYPDDLPIIDYANPVGRQFMTALNDACVNQILSQGFGHSVDDFGSDFTLFFAPRTRAIMRDNSIENYEGVPGSPVFEWHSPTDVLLPLPELDATMARWRAEGTPVTQLQVPAPDHLSAALIGLPAAVQWLAGRFAQAQ